MTIVVDDETRRLIRKEVGEKGLATREDVRIWAYLALEGAALRMKEREEETNRVFAPLDEEG